jgi:uncharacterized membrane protein
MPEDAAAAKGGNGSTGYTSVNLGALLGDYSSSARSVNDAGDVVGTSGAGAFAIVAGAVVTLPGNAFFANGISNGNPLYVAGSAQGQPVRWSIANGVASDPMALQLAAASFGVADGVNDAGSTVGNAGPQAAIWDADGNLIVTLLPDGFVRGEGRGINNAGHAVFVFLTSGPEWSSARAHLRLASGHLVELAPLSGDVTSYANDVSEVSNNSVYVAGTTRTSQYVFRAVRWTVDVTTGDVTDVQVRSENSHGLAVSNTGDVAGFLETNPERTPRFKAFLWRGTTLLQLSPPKGGKDGVAWAMSPGGALVAGEAFFGTSRRALRWAIASP